jgi:hypothetical protein
MNTKQDENKFTETSCVGRGKLQRKVSPISQTDIKKCTHETKMECYLKRERARGVVAHVYNPSTGEAEGGGYQVQGQLYLACFSN